MKLSYIVLIILVIVVIIGVAYYIKLINSYKAFVLKEKKLMKDITDASVDEYIALYKSSYIPKSLKILTFRTKFYLAVKQSENVSYQKKKVLLTFFKEQGIPVFSTTQNTTQTSDDDFDIDMDDDFDENVE